MRNNLLCKVEDNNARAAFNGRPTPFPDAKAKVTALTLKGNSQARTDSALLIMCDLVRAGAHDPRIRQSALELVDGCLGHAFWCEIENLFYHVRDDVAFRRDPVAAEWLQDALWTAGLRGVAGFTGDCDDKVIYLGALLGALGHETRFKIYTFAGLQWDHIALQVYYHAARDRSEDAPQSDQWITLDPTGEHLKPGDDIPAAGTATVDIWPEGKPDKPPNQKSDNAWKSIVSEILPNPVNVAESLLPGVVQDALAIVANPLHLLGLGDGFSGPGSPRPISSTGEGATLIPGIDYTPGRDFVGVPTGPLIDPFTGQITVGPGSMGSVYPGMPMDPLNQQLLPFQSATGAQPNLMPNVSTAAYLNGGSAVGELTGGSSGSSSLSGILSSLGLSGSVSGGGSPRNSAAIVILVVLGVFLATRKK